MIALEHLATEQRNPASRNIDTLPTLDILRIINAEDRKIAPAIELVLGCLTPKNPKSLTGLIFLRKFMFFVLRNSVIYSIIEV